MKRNPVVEFLVADTHKLIAQQVSVITEAGKRPISNLKSLLGDYWWAKSLLGLAVLGGDITLAALSVEEIREVDCEGTECEGKQKPAYSMSIITYGEGNPQGDNLSEEQLQLNRRVDVSISDVPESAPAAEQEEVSSGGVIWATTDPAELTRQLEVTTPNSVELEKGVLAGPVKIRLFSNYASFVERWEVRFFDATDLDRSKPVATLAGDAMPYESELDWNGVLDNGKSVRAGDQLLVVLRVYDAENRVDETYPVSLDILGPNRNLVDSNQTSLAAIALEQRDGRSQLARQEILINGSRVRIYGRDLGDARTVTINGETITLDDNRQFAAEYLLPDGEHDFAVTVTGENGGQFDKDLSVTLDNQYMFMVGLADVTVGQSNVSGAIDSLDVSDDSRFGGDLFVDGRLAFYLKGKVKGKYLVTAQMDTGTDDIEKIFNDLHRKDPSSLFRRLDPDRYYPVYGDDSTLIDDTDSQGKLYVRVDWDHSRALWGNFNTGVTGTEFAQFNRSLYGAQLKKRSKTFTKDGEHKTDINVFASEAQSAHRHNEFLGTGGSLYYLRDKDIVRGSEKVWVEIRQRETERVIERIELVEGRDYQIDDFQGRLILNRPLQSVSSQSAPSIIKDQPLDGNDIWLAVDYEYVPDDFKLDELTAGVRGKHWLSDRLAIGGTWVLERRGAETHDVKGIDATWKVSDDSWIRGEIARSENSQTLGSFRSDDGGLNFSPFVSNTAASSNYGFAGGVEARLDLQERFSLRTKTVAESWFKYRNEGFAAAGFDSGYDTVDAGVEVSGNLNEKFALSARATVLDKESYSYLSTLSIQADIDVTDRMTVTGEMRQVSEEDRVANTDGKGQIIALKTGFDINNRMNVYGIWQNTVSATGSYDDNDLLTLGIRSDQSDALGFNAEVSTGDRGDSAQAGVEYRIDADHSVYATQKLSTDTTQGVRNTTTVGQRRTLGSKLRVFTEHQFTDEDLRSGVGHTFGMDYDANRYTRFNASYQHADIDDQTGGTTDRDALSVGADYKRGRRQASTRFEYRLDKSPNANTEQWVTANNVNYIKNASLRYQGRFNHSVTKDKNNGTTSARFTEAGVGFALRPVQNDSLNMLGRLTWLYDLPTISQGNQPDERALLGSLEFSYVLNRKWETGGKIAYKDAEIRTDRSIGQWVGNDAMLLAARLRYHLLFRWDALAEYHWLYSESSKDTEHGLLLSLGRHVGDNLTFSLGYNFTRFDDNLANDTADVDGWFVNLVGKY